VCAVKVALLIAIFGSILDSVAGVCYVLPEQVRLLNADSALVCYC